MNRIIPILTLLAILSACTTDFDLEAEYKDIPIVYAFISPQDTAHYVRVQKAFLEPGGNALEIAQNPDSIYYGADEATITIEQMETGDSYVLQRVNGNDEGYVKEEGDFASDPNILYKLPVSVFNLEPGDPIRLIINKNDNENPATAETVIAGVIDSAANSPSIKITRWDYSRPKRFSWKTDPANKIFDVRLVINYREFPSDDPSLVEEKSVTWVMDDAVINDNESSSMSIEAFGVSFYSYLGQSIPEIPNVIRLFDDMDLIVTGSGEEFLDFVRLQQANTGITSAQNIPTYTNIDGGLGVFTSRFQMVRPRLILDLEAKDSLRSGIYTKHLNFR